MSDLCFAKIAAVTDSGVKLIFSGEDTATVKSYRYLESYTPAADDRVACLKCGGSYLVLGKIH